MSDENGDDVARKLPKKKVRQIAISRLKAGEQPFLAWGYSRIKGMQLVPDEANPDSMTEEEVEFVVPIKSVGVADISDRIARVAPQPPVTRELIKPDSPEGKELGLKHAKLVDKEDYTDPNFKELLRKHLQRNVYASVLAGLALDVVNGDGSEYVRCNGHNQPSEILDEEKAIEVLKSQGLSNPQFDQIYADIMALTTKEKEKVDQE